VILKASEEGHLNKKATIKEKQTARKKQMVKYAFTFLVNFF
jgi:hypothetical protein